MKTNNKAIPTNVIVRDIATDIPPQTKCCNDIWCCCKCCVKSWSCVLNSIQGVCNICATGCLMCSNTCSGCSKCIEEVDCDGK